MTTRAHCFLIDAPTSRASVYSQLIGHVASVVDGLSKASIMVLCGSRIDLLNHSRQCLVKHFPKCRPWIAQLTNGQHQIWSQKPGYLIFLQLEHGKPTKARDDKMPHTLDILSSCWAATPQNFFLSEAVLCGVFCFDRLGLVEPQPT